MGAVVRYRALRLPGIKKMAASKTGSMLTGVLGCFSRPDHSCPQSRSGPLAAVNLSVAMDSIEKLNDMHFTKIPVITF